MDQDPVPGVARQMFILIRYVLHLIFIVMCPPIAPRAPLYPQGPGPFAKQKDHAGGGGLLGPPIYLS